MGGARQGVVGPFLMGAGFGMASFRIGHDVPMFSASTVNPGGYPNGDQQKYLRIGNPPSRACCHSLNRVPNNSHHTEFASATTTQAAREPHLPTPRPGLRRTPGLYRHVRSESLRTGRSSPSGNRTGRSFREEPSRQILGSVHSDHRPYLGFSRECELCGNPPGQATPPHPWRVAVRPDASRYRREQSRRERSACRSGPFDAQALQLQ